MGNSKKIILDLCGEKVERAMYFDHKGYPCIRVRRKEYKVHVLIWESKFGKKPNGYEIHHKDQDKSNYDIENLELMTPTNHRRLHAGWIRTNNVWTHKHCNKCNEVLPLNDFYYVKTRSIESALWGKFNEPIKTVTKKPDGMVKFSMLHSKDIFPQYYGKFTRQERRAITPPGFANAFFKANQ